MYADIFKRIIKASQTESLTFFVGAGVSKLSNAPKWSELIDAFSDRIGREKKSYYSNEEYLSIPQMYYYSIDQDDSKYYNFINNCFGSKKLIPNAIHKMLLDLNPHAFITTNFDDLLETAVSENCQSFKVVACDDEISEISGNRFILKLHGDLNHRNIVLKEEDYLNYSENFKLVETLLKSIFATNTVVFIGYGLNDYNIKLILNWTKTLLKEKFNKPIFIYTDDAELSKNELRYHKSKGLYVVDYRHCADTEPIDFIDRYKNVLNAINDSSYFSVKGKNEIEVFELLYDLLAPLDKMDALRIQDIKEKLRNKVIIESCGVINISVGESILFKHFVAINDMNESDRMKFDSGIVHKYQTIVSVLSKAQIRWIRCSDHKYQKIADDNFVFANPCCMQFDYIKMQEYVSKEYDDYYIDSHIHAITNNESFDSLSKHSGLNYPNLIRYLYTDDCFRSRKLALRITKIVKNSYLQLKNEVKWHYYSYLSASQQKSIIKWICDGLVNEFLFDDFLFLVNHDVKIDKKTLTALKKYLRKQIELSKKETPIKIYPKHDNYYALNLVGYFCRSGSLNRKDFFSFLNYSPIFDLFYKFEKFDFENFDVTWLLQWQEKMIKTLSENKIVRSKI